MLAAKWEVWCAALGVDVRWEAANESTFPNQHQRSNQNSRRMKNKFGVIDRSLNWTVGGRGWTNFPSRSDSLFTPQISSFHYIFWRNVTNHLPICWPWLLTCCRALLAAKKLEVNIYKDRAKETDFLRQWKNYVGPSGLVLRRWISKDWTHPSLIFIPHLKTQAQKY